MSPHPLTQELVELPGGLKLELSLTCPSVYPSQALPTSEGKLAICLHPWSWLGGQMDDPVLRAVEDVLLELGFNVIRYNSRGVGRSSGWPSFTGTTEGQDLRLLVEWALTQIPNIKSVVIFGYSYGSLISSLFPILPEPIKTSHILLSYPLGPRSWLTAFSGRSYTSTLNALLHDPRANILVIYSDQDEFTAEGSYDNWVKDLRKEYDGNNHGRLDVVKVEGANHFWSGLIAGRSMIESIRFWLS